MNLADEMTKKLKAVVDGQVTWAELEGITFEQAQEMAQTGCELADDGRLDEARQLFEGMTAINPKDSAALAALGTVYQKLDRLADAVAADPEGELPASRRATGLLTAIALATAKRHQGKAPAGKAKA